MCVVYDDSLFMNTSHVIVDQPIVTSTIPLERPASVRRHLPLASNLGWMLPEYIVGPENETLRYLFGDRSLGHLEQLSPIVFYGDKEVGKTALSITLAVSWARSTSLRPLCITSGRSFVADFSAAVEIDDLDSFRSRHRACKLLLIDDLEALAQASASQNELVSTLDVLAELGRPVIVTLNRLPSTIAGLNSALTSRLSGGFSVPLLKPRPATLEKLVPALILTIDRKLPAVPLVELCVRLSAKNLSVPDVQKVIMLAAQNKNANGEVDMHVVGLLAQQLFSDAGPTLPGIAKVVARKLQVRLVEMRGATRQANIVRARGLAILLSRKLTSSSLQKIGEFFGGRDHSTIIHACRKTEKLLDSDSELANLLQEVQTEVLQA